MEKGDDQALRDILATIDRAIGFPIPDFDTLAETDFLQDALLRCLEVMGEATKRLSVDFRVSHPEVPWRAMAGLRDVLFMRMTESTSMRSGRRTASSQGCGRRSW